MAADVEAAEAVVTEFGILGPLEVCRSGRAVPLGGPRQRAVLALLLLEANRAVSMDRLAEDVWGGDPPEGWATTLQTYVFHLRRALEPDRARGDAGGVLVTRDRGYLLRVDREHLDAALFQDGFTAGRAALQAGRYAEAAETLRGALDLWRGPVLADLADYAFIQREAVRLEELRLAAVEARIDADLALGRHDALTAELEQLTADQPLRERLHGQLMLALYRCGRQADALAAYRHVRDLLADELGIDPGEPLQRLHAAVLAHDPELDWTGGRHAPVEAQLAAAPRFLLRRRGHLAGGRGPPGAGLGAAAGPPPTGRRLGAGGRRGRVHCRGGPAVGGRAGRPARRQRGPDRLIGGPGRRPGDGGQPGGPGLGTDGSVWVVDSAEGTVSRINPVTHAMSDDPGRLPIRPRWPSPARTRGWPTAATGRCPRSTPRPTPRCRRSRWAMSQSPSPAGPAACGWPTRATTPWTGSTPRPATST